MNKGQSKAELLAELEQARQRLAALEARLTDQGQELNDLAERQRAEQKSQRSEQTLRLFVEHSPAAIAMFDREMRYLVVSHRFLTDFQLGEQDLVGRSHYEIFPEMTEDRIEIHRRCLAGEVVKCDEDPLLRQDGRLDWVRYELRPWYETNGEVGGLIFFSEVITARKLAEQKLRENEERYRALIENAPDGIVLIDVAGKFKEVSPSVERLFGYSQAEALLRSPVELTHPDDLSFVLLEFARVIAEPGSLPTLQYRFRHKNGEWRWIESTFRNLLALPSVEAIVINFRDIHERKLAEAALQKSQALLTEAQRIGRIGHMEWNGRDAALICSEEIYDILGLPPGAVISKELISSLMTPAERERLNHLDQQAIRQRDDMDYVYCIQLKDGSERWLRQVGKVTYNAQGAPIRMMATIQDVTKQKEAERNLDESRVRVEMALEGANAAMWDWNIQTGETVFNERLVQMLGYALSELEPISIQTWNNLCHPADLELSNELLQKHFSGETLFYECEARLKHKNGSWVWVIDRGKVMEWDAKGQPLRMLGTHLDITGRKREQRYTEARLRLANLANQLLDMDTLMRTMLDEAEALTESQIGFFHFVNDDQNTISLQAWSTNTIETMCSAEGKGQHYPVAQAGMWADSIRTGETCIFNDYAALPTRRELPRGHAPVTRLISLPIKRNGLVVAAIGVGNKSRDYDDYDREIVGRLAEEAFDIILRQRTEQQLRESEERFRTVADFTYDMEYWLGENQQLLYLSPSCKRLTGYSREDILQNPTLLEQMVHPADREEYLQHLLSEFSNPEPMSLDFRLVTASGEVRWINHTCHAVTGQDGQARGRRASNHEITERKRSEQQIRQQMEDLALVNTLNEAANRGESLEKISALLNQEFRRIFNCKDSGIYLLSPDKKYLELQYISLSGSIKRRIEKLIGRSIPKVKILIKSSGYFNQVFSSERGLVTSDPHLLQDWIRETADTPFLPAAVRPVVKILVPQIFKLLGIHSVITMPLKSAGKILGAVEISSQNSLSESDLERLQNVRTSLTEILRRKLVEQELVESEQKYRSLHESMIDGFVRVDMSGKILEFNEIYRQMLGYAAEELWQVTYQQLTPESCQADEAQVVNEQILKRGYSDVYEKEYRRQDGSIFPVELHTVLMRDEQGQPGSMWANVRDITERKRVENALRESERKLSTLLSNLVGFAYRCRNDSNWSMEYISSGCQAVTGYLPEDLVGNQTLAYNDLILPADRNLVWETIQAALDMQSLYQLEYRIVTHEGAERWVWEQGRGVFESERLLALEGYITDITDRKSAEHSLRSSEEKYRGLLASLDSVVVALDATGVLLYVNDVATQPMGVPPANLIGKNLHEVFPKEYAVAQMAAVQQVFREDRLIVRESQIFVLGQPRWYRTSYQPIHDEHGQVAQVLVNATDIDQIKTIQQELQELNRTLEQRVRQRTAEVQDLYDNAPVGYHSLDAERRFIAINQTELNMLGYTREELLGQPNTIAFAPESAPTLRDNFPRLLAEGRVIDLEVMAKRKDGSLFPVMINAVAMYDQDGKFVSSRSTLTDITRRKLAENELKRNVNFTTALLEAIPTPVFYKDQVGRYLGCNRAFAEITGQTAEEIHGKTVHELWPSEQAEFYHQKDLELLQEKKRQIYESTIVNQQGQAYPVIYVKDVFYDETGQVAGLVGAFIDITERKRAEDTLRHANLELARAMRMKDDFLANMSHELRTPLNGILGLSEALQLKTYGMLSEKQLRALRNIESSGRHLLSLINDILDLSKIEAGKLEIHPETIRVVEVCQASLAFIKELALKKGITTSFEPDPLVITIQADLRRLKQILVNLLSNAVKFTPAGGKLTLKVQANLQQQVVELSVSDTGIGISATDLARLFQPFTQVDSSLTRKHEGSGLGLALVKELAELHGGQIRVQSEVGQGSTFTVSLPWQPDALAWETLAALEQPTETAPVTVGPPPARLEKILLAEDAELNIMAVGDYLENQGYQMIYARDGREALAIAREQFPDLILMDVQMPELDGLTVTRQLRTDPQFAEVPIIALTAMAMTGDRERCLEAGATDYVSKPLVLRELVEMMRKLLDQRPAKAR